MTTKKMLIDSVHPEEIRVALTEENRLDDFDFETEARRPIKGNIYLAKVTRVEPSLQAAFVEYGGNRQGFLPFSEIHFDYFQIPVEDKKKIQQEVEDQRKKLDEDSDIDDEDGDVISQENDMQINRSAHANLLKKYKIQEVIKRNQIILVQIIKEERGSKGASLTTFISLPGKYCVLMPKTDNQGGVSRKITDIPKRKKLRSIVKGLDTQNGMSVIIRTAGSNCTKAEIKRDYAYLSSLWEKIRDNALKSKAPSIIYQEGNIIQRSIRDMFDNSIDEIVIEGKDAFKSAKNFMKLLTPAYADRVKEHKKSDPIFWEYEVEDDLATLYEVEVPLESGGYIVLNPTEALVAIDVNSGKATKQRSVEETALKTNLEAAKAISRQLRLRDLSGLIVIDFIDMLELKNKKTVERALKDALRKDRARIQVGRISTFGLLEMSRQRLSSSVVENSTVTCPRCRGLGRVRSKHSSSVTLMREIEHDSMLDDAPEEIKVFTSKELADYMKKERKEDLKRVEGLCKGKIVIKADKNLLGAQFAIGDEALKELIEELDDSGDSNTNKEEYKVVKFPGKPVLPDDVKDSEIVIVEEDDDHDVIEDSPQSDNKQDDDFRPRRPRRNNKGPNNRGDKGARGPNRGRNKKNPNRDGEKRSGNNSGNREKVEDFKDGNRAKRPSNKKPYPKKDINDNSPKSGSSSKSEPTEQEKSIIKSLWKKIRD